MTKSIKKIVLELLNPQQMVFVATSFNDQPYVRPMTLIYNKKRFFFATGSNDAKAAQIAVNPLVEICLPLKVGKYSGYVRARGKLLTITDKTVRQDIFDAAAFIGYYWQEPTDPGYVLYQMQWQEVDYLKPGDNLATTISWT